MNIHAPLRAIAAAVAAGLFAVLLSGCVPPEPAPSSTPPTSPAHSSTATPTAPPSEGPVPTPTYTEPPSKPTPTPDAPTPTDANVQILNTQYDPSTGTVRVDALVANIVSDSGTCTLNVSQDAQSIQSQITSTADATVTYCANMQAALPADSSGTWTVTVFFQSDSSKGSTSGQVVV